MRYKTWITIDGHQILAPNLLHPHEKCKKQAWIHQQIKILFRKTMLYRAHIPTTQNLKYCCAKTRMEVMGKERIFFIRWWFPGFCNKHALLIKLEIIVWKKKRKCFKKGFIILMLELFLTNVQVSLYYPRLIQPKLCVKIRFHNHSQRGRQ